MPALMERPNKALPSKGFEVTQEPVAAEGTEIRLRPQLMEVGRYYLAELNGKPYLYRRVTESEVEVYGLPD